jgi:hypothetical protein
MPVSFNYFPEKVFLLSPEEPICAGGFDINSGDLITNRNANYYCYCLCKQVQILAGRELKPMKRQVFYRKVPTLPAPLPGEGADKVGCGRVFSPSP